MKIDELAERTGFNRRVIYKLIRIGLLPQPAKLGSQQSAFDDRHVDALLRLSQLQKDGPESQSEPRDGTQPVASGVANEEPPSVDKKKQIMDRAIALFSKNGFENTKLSDITDSLGLGKGTFYLYFKSKKDLLIECIGQLSSAVVERESWEQLRNEPDFVRRQRITLLQFLKAFPTFNGIHILLAASLQSDDPEIVEKAKGYFKILSGWLRKDLRRAIEDKAVRNVDTDIMSALMLGMAQGLGTMLSINPKYSMEQGIEAFLDILQRGIVSSKVERPKAVRWDVVDTAGLHAELLNLRIDEKPYLSIELGQGEVQVPLEKISSLQISRGNGGQTAEAAIDDGAKKTFPVDGNRVLSGDFGYGLYRIQLEKLSRIDRIPEAGNEGAETRTTRKQPGTK